MTCWANLALLFAYL